MSYITTEDFDTILAQSIETTEVIQEYIDRFENVYIRQILGVELGNLFIADANPGPATPPYDALEDAIIEQEDGIIYESAGMKQILIYFILYEYVKGEQAKNSQSGGVIANAETSNVLGFENATRYGETRFNEALEWAHTIQWYCCTFKPTDYPEFDGVKIRAKYSALL